MSTEEPIAKPPKRARGLQRVAELLDAGAALFAENGYETTTMTQIAQHAGASIGSLYQFSPSKGALAEALFARYVERVTSMLEDLARHAPGLSPQGLAGRLVDLMLDVRKDRDSTAALSGSVSGIVERRQSLRGANRRQIVAILRAADPKLRETAAAEAAAMIGHVLKLVPMLAKEQEDGGQPLVAQVRKMLAAYIDRVVRH
jgi:AcrR family transcriptional regulator